MSEPDELDFATWLQANPPPSVQELVAKHGGYQRIPPDAWAEWDHRILQWEAARKDRLLGSRTWAMLGEARMLRARPSRKNKSQRP